MPLPLRVMADDMTMIAGNVDFFLSRKRSRGIIRKGWPDGDIRRVVQDVMQMLTCG
jgi:hypothetical protein